MRMFPGRPAWNSLTRSDITSGTSGRKRKREADNCGAADAMAGERRSGSLLVQISPRQQAFPEELIRQRRTHDGQTEHLVRWCLAATEDAANSGGGASETGGASGGGVGATGASSSGSSTSGETKAENVLMWMTTEDVYANCPALLGKRKADPQRPPQEEHDNSVGAENFDEVELSDMKEDVKNLVRRARKQMSKQQSQFSMATMHTIHVLSAYAAIGSLVAVFKETGALNLLMELLCNKETATRRSAGKMLRALASHDAGSRAYVLLSLSQQDGIEQLMDFENRFTLLELFAETSEEHGISFEGVHLPQIPGKLLFSLVKRYLRVTSLMDKLNTVEAEPASEWHEAGPVLSTSPTPSTSSSAQQGELLRLQREFEFSMAMANLISELVRVMGWDRDRRTANRAGASAKEAPRPVPRSIFQPRSGAPPVLLPIVPTPPPPKKKPGFKTRADFSSRSSYVDYVQEHLTAGMTVRMLEDYEEVSVGDQGEFRYSNDGSPPLQVYWNSLSRTYWVHWHMVEILGNSPVEKISSPLPLPPASQTFFSRPPGGLYSLPYLAEQQQETDILSRAEWWEVLFFIQKLEEEQQQEVHWILRQSLEEQEMDGASLVGLSVPADAAKKILHLLKQKLPSSCLKDLLSSHTYTQHYLRRGGVSLEEEEEELLADVSSAAGGATAAAAGGGGQSSVSKKAKKEAPQDAEAEPELLEELGPFPKDLEENMKAFDTSRVKAWPTLLEKIGEVVGILRSGESSSPPSSDQQLAAVHFIMRLLREKGHQEQNPHRSNLVLIIREKVLKALVELLGSSSREVVLSSLRLTQMIMLRFDMRVFFATEGGVKAILSRMQEFSSDIQLQQHGLAALKVITGAGKHDVVGGASCIPLSESGSQMMLEIFASIGSATPSGSRGLLGVIPDAIDLLLQSKGSMVWVRSGLLLLIMLVLDHQSLAEQLLACDVLSVLRKCVSLPRAESTLAIIALNHLSNTHKLDRTSSSSELLDLQMLVVSLKELTATKEVIVTLEKLLCDDNTQLEEERLRVTRSRETFQDVVRLMELHRADQATQLSLIRILNLFLDQDQEDLLPWHESIETCLTSMTAFITDREVVQRLVRFLYRLASLNRDYAVVMCRLGTREALQRAAEKHSNIPLTSDLRDLLVDCDRHASLFKKMTTSVLAGCIQMVLGQIEEHRRSHQPINIPFFDVFLKNLCQGTSVELKEEKCWEKMEVSSNSHRLNKLTDKNPKSYWESNGCTGTHWINIHMHKGVILRELSMLVSSEDSSYMPGRIVILAGDDPAAINTELTMVNVPPTATRMVLLENLTRPWNIIQIRIKRCQQGGIDTRVRGLEVLGPQPTFWPVFKEQLCCRTFLFYSTKAQSWSQEVKEDRSRLLLLFNKLNCALKHEQMFADRFLPDAEASEALGKTCWEALITPIVRNITHSDSSASSALSWLLTEYLENAESARRLKSRAAIFNSRVRRLTHLLVHVDTSRGDGPDLKPPPKSYGKENKNKDSAPTSSATNSSTSSARPKVTDRSSSSITDIALCWQGVVQQQVKRFLESDCRLPDFVERYWSLYQRLKNATEELFGQQTAFILALRDGFSAALLQLSILRAMHVSERFSQYLDEMITCSVGGSSENLQHLHNFMESILFLSGLEITNTFEHFYRYYLGDRLLSRGSVWLEKVVIEHIGSCFPSRLPQQMLKNLSESEELQQEFHLFRLQQLDQRLQNSDQVMEEWVESEEEADVQVLVLSPRCWAVSSLCYMEEPDRLLPPQLCCYLNHFKHFYAHSQSLLTLSHLQPRRLQWTWLGHADLLMGRWTLNVSTVQMFILLHFNQEEEVRVQDLLQESGLCEEVLFHALLPLTAEGGPLTCSHPEDTHQGVLQVSQQVWSRCEDQEEVVRLLPAQTYLKVEEDAAGTLERKRSFICCLIVNILKQEKEMHIDNLVFKVLESCQRREAGPVGKVGGVSCSTADVLSCMTQVISRGCARRNQEQPHLVEFLPDTPTTPQKGHAHFCFSSTNSEGGTSVSPGPRRLDDGVLDAVLFSMGRTMSQEEVRQLMKRTVQQVSETLSLDVDCTEHLLVHCRWNVDQVVQRYTDDPENLVIAAGLKCKSPAPTSTDSAPATCPVCLTARPVSSEKSPTLSCQHYCCKSCWEEYLTSRVEQNLVMNCNCPITDCQAQPTSSFFLSVLTDKDTVAKYEGALLRGFVESCSNLTWCTNPLGCDQILCKENMSSMGTCCKCCWSSCFNCNFPQAHYPASCSHMSQWMDDGGFYEGMSVEALSKHLAKLISKRCPSCQSQIEKNEGCLHMTCAKCHHGFCWRCLKPWKPTHKDFYNCAAMVSKAARQEKKFLDYNERCAFHYQAKDFALSLENKVSSINEALQMKSLTFVIDACKVLAQARKVLAFSSVYSYYNQETEKMDVMDQQTEALDLHTNALQILLEENLLQSSDLASCVRLLKPEHLNSGLELIRRIQERLLAILQHSTQDFRVGFHSNSQDAESTENNRTKTQESKVDGASDSAESDNNNAGEEGGEEEDDEYDEDYVPEWHEDYEEDDVDEDDFFSDDDESENLERDFSPFD